MPGKGRAMSYTDYYKNNSSAPGDSMGADIAKRTDVTKKTEVDEAAEKRKAAVQRRLRMRKAGK